MHYILSSARTSFSTSSSAYLPATVISTGVAKTKTSFFKNLGKRSNNSLFGCSSST